MPLSQEAKASQKAAFKNATAQAIATATAKAEIAIETVLKRLARDTMLKIERVSVDTENHPTCSVEIYLKSSDLTDTAAE